MLLNVVCFLSLGVCGWIVSLCSGCVGCCAWLAVTRHGGFDEVGPLESLLIVSKLFDYFESCLSM